MTMLMANMVSVLYSFAMYITWFISQFPINFSRELQTLKTVVSRKLISVFEICYSNSVVGWQLLIFCRKTSFFVFFVVFFIRSRLKRCHQGISNKIC